MGIALHIILVRIGPLASPRPNTLQPTEKSRMSEV